MRKPPAPVVRPSGGKGAPPPNNASQSFAAPAAK